MVLAFGLFIAEFFTTTFGILTAGGITALVLGSLLLFPGRAPLFQVSPWLIAVITILFVAFFLFVIQRVIRAHRGQASTGWEELVGKPMLTTVYALSSREKARHLFWKWKKEGALRNEELIIVTKDGRERVVLLSAAAMRDSKGDIVHSISVQRDITEKKKVEEQINKSLKEKEVLIKEIHHRVKNNMQIVLSLLNLQSASIENAELLTRFQESQRRIQSMAVIHEKLYQSEDFAHIDFSDCIRILAEEAIHLYGADVTLTIDANPVFLGIDTAIPCGLIVNELVSNAAKHAFPEGGGEIFITVRGNGHTVELTVADNGVGIPDAIDFRTTESLGLSLVTLLAEEQLNGTIDLDMSKGTVFCITFEK